MIPRPILQRLDTKDIRVLDSLDMPRTTSEVYRELLRRVWEAWAEEQGYGEVEIDDQGLAQPPLVRLLSWSWARNRGWDLDRTAVYNRLRKLEKAGLVNRLQMPSHTRSILWLRVDP